VLSLLPISTFSSGPAAAAGRRRRRLLSLFLVHKQSLILFLPLFYCSRSPDSSEDRLLTNGDSEDSFSEEGDTKKEKAARGRKVQRGQGTPMRRSRSLDDDKEEEEEDDDDDGGGVLVEQAESGADSKGDDDCSEEDVEEEAEEEVSALLGCFGPRCPFALPGILTRSPHLLLFAACCSSWAWTGNAPSSSSSQQQRSRASSLARSALVHFAD